MIPAVRRVHISELILHGVPLAERHAYAAALQRALSRQLRSPGAGGADRQRLQIASSIADAVRLAARQRDRDE